MLVISHTKSNNAYHCCRRELYRQRLPRISKEETVHSDLHCIAEYQETNPHAIDAEMLTGGQTGETESVCNSCERFFTGVSRMDSVDIGFEGMARGKGKESIRVTPLIQCEWSRFGEKFE